MPKETILTFPTNFNENCRKIPIFNIIKLPNPTQNTSIHQSTPQKVNQSTPPKNIFNQKHSNISTN